MSEAKELASAGQAATPVTLTSAGRCGGKKTGHQYEALVNELERLVREGYAREYVAYRLTDAANAIRDLTRARDAILKEAATAAHRAVLPDGFQWGSEAMEHFKFGKYRAAAAVLALASKPAASGGE